ncbi:flagellar biosynthesis anti-sigma factor FlgM [Crateriforma spongiae]|uniref:flagellar biosynthesis anti-sigma factor FlgM n=1 Tax=Crateriforma spongiae TaxID=2724528 RepID=UPI0014475EC1|nr:flagellar biosynthesis anti-sigma factor FlgM [Crateriforma spongiae]
MQIYGPYRVSTQQPVGPSSRTAKPAAPAEKTAASSVDQLDLSSAATAANRLSGITSPSTESDIRVDRVAEIRRQIASGSYDTPEKMDAALDRFLDQYA